ncbi:hypothetical protein NBRC110019_07440 [Neptunitalea chrysea]|uniref:Uncharacterized protein n=1 Tax=Neptunitalea chrysea TaxID=1647581 RepID=A0A9W6B4X5_9FLAO|nr:hypothetical protein [Neptunitalea chrysea]GLB51705.1 hypothetical protein NBRC110019_07440 [Neptunitalea chrysea]
MEKKPTINKPFGDEAIQTHAAKVGGKRNLREVEITTDDGDYVFVYLVKKPSRAVMEAIADAESKGKATTDKGQPTKKIQDPGRVQKLLLGCVLEGDKDAYEYDGAIYTQLLKYVGELVKEARGTLKKL